MMYFDFRLDLGYQQLVVQPMVMLNSQTSEAIADPFPFQSLKDLTEQKLSRIASHKAALPDDWATQSSKNGKFSLDAQEWGLYAKCKQGYKSQIATLRMVYIRGHKNEIINTWIFPTRSDLMPVFAAELISTASVTRVAFIDIQTPNLNTSNADEVRLLTAPLAARFARLPCDEAAPAWATEASQGNFTYARQADATWTTTIQNVYTSYLDTYLSAFVATKRSIEPEIASPVPSATAQLRAYQHHHMSSSPGKKFLSTLFGADWTESFLSEFLFSPPLRTL